MKKLYRIAIIAILAFMPMILSAQTNSREHIRNQISYQGNCRNVAITKTGGDLMLYGTNGYASMGCPSGLISALKELHDDGEYIDDVQITEGGKWLVLYGDNGFQWYGIPYSLEQKIREYNNDNEIINCVAFNDEGDWVVISEDYYSASDSELLDWLEEGHDKYGQLWTACITNDCIVAVYEEGFRGQGDIPDSLWDKLNETDIDVFRLKIAGTAWFFANKDGSDYDYFM